MKLEKMDLDRHYTNLYNGSIRKIAENDYSVDTRISDDKRRGITLLIRPSCAVKEKILKFLNDVRCLEPNQYYYPVSDMHITVLSIISCYEGFDISQIPLFEYEKAVEKSISSIPPFKMDFNGITASPSCIMIQGYPENDNLHDRTLEYKSNIGKSIIVLFSIV